MRQCHSPRLGIIFKELRKQRGLTQEQLAERAGVERNYIYYLEKGMCDPTLGVLVGLAQGYGLRFSQFAALLEPIIDVPSDEL